MVTFDDNYQHESSGKQILKLLNLFWQDGRLCLGTPESGELFFIKLVPNAETQTSNPQKIHSPSSEYQSEGDSQTKIEADIFISGAESEEETSQPSKPQSTRQIDRDHEVTLGNKLIVNYKRVENFMNSECELPELQAIYRHTTSSRKYDNLILPSKSRTKGKGRIPLESAYQKAKKRIIEDILRFHIYKKKSLESLINFIDIGCKQYGLVIPPIRDHYMLAEELTPDVFISYNSQDRLFVHETANRLSKRGIESWIDDRELTPGDDWYDEFERLLPSISSVVIFIGKNGRGRWQEEEIKIFKDEEVQRKLSSEKLRLMVVALKDYDDDRNKFPAFLRSKIFIDCRQVSDYVDRLTRGITSINPFKE